MIRIFGTPDLSPPISANLILQTADNNRGRLDNFQNPRLLAVELDLRRDLRIAHCFDHGSRIETSFCKNFLKDMAGNARPAGVKEGQLFGCVSIFVAA